MAPSPSRIKKISNIGKMNRINTISKIPNINPLEFIIINGFMIYKNVFKNQKKEEYIVLLF